ncbi:MAG: hypothetical protein ACR2PO_00100 [Methyloligellaceae bacterium]
MTVRQFFPALRRVLGGLLCGFYVLLSGHTASLAAGVSIKGDNASDQLTIRIENAKVEDVLGKLAQTFGFEFDRAAGSNSSASWSATLTGDLESILDRLLRNRNHSIVRSPGAPGTIRRIVLIDAYTGSKPVASRPTYKGNRTTANGKRVSANSQRKSSRPTTGK